MTVGEALLLGLLQGLTEFLPISSSAHLRIAGPLLSMGDPGAAFTAVIQIGTEAAVLLYFRKEIWWIVRAWLCQAVVRDEAARTHVRLGWLIIVGTVPIAILGLLFKEAIEGVARNLYLTAIMLILFGLLLGWADRRGRKDRPLVALSWRDGFLLGLAQALALIPGVSRSGGTITAGLMLGYSRDAAARYSFLLAVPAVLASGIFELVTHWDTFRAQAALPTAIATITAFATGFLVIIGFLRLVSTRGYLVFVYYRLLLGTLLLGLLLSGAISPV
nr:undecaprenyl-diphosphate phosphatase [Sphingobium sp.]